MQDITFWSLSQVNLMLRLIFYFLDFVLKIKKQITIEKGIAGTI